MPSALAGSCTFLAKHASCTLTQQMLHHVYRPYSAILTCLVYLLPAERRV